MDVVKEREVLQKCLCASVGKEKCKKITEQFISVAVENNLNYSGAILHDFMRLAEIELSRLRGGIDTETHVQLQLKIGLLDWISTKLTPPSDLLYHIGAGNTTRKEDKTWTPTYKHGTMKVPKSVPLQLTMNRGSLQRM